MAFLTLIPRCRAQSALHSSAFEPGQAGWEERQAGVLPSLLSRGWGFPQSLQGWSLLKKTPASVLDPQDQHTHLGEITGMDRLSLKELLSLHRTWNGTGNRVHTHALLLTKKNKKPWKAWQNSLNLSNPGHSKTCGVTFNPVPFDNPGKTALASLFILAQHSNHPF